MSFAYMPLFTGDYLRDTRHLSPQRHGIYLLGLMYCWDSKGPMPLDEQECAGICNCRSSDEIEALRYILNRYFIRMDDGHYNKRMTDEVAKTERLSGAFREAGLKSAEARRAKARSGKANAEPTFNLPSTEAEPRLVSPSPSPSPSKEEENAPRKRSATPPPSPVDMSTPKVYNEPVKTAPTRPDDVDPQTWADWLQLRKAKKAPVTQTVINGAVKEASKAGMSLTDFLAVWCQRGSQGLEASWLKDSERKPAAESFRERDARIGAEHIAALTGGMAQNRAALKQSHSPAPWDIIEGAANASTRLVA